MPVFYRNVITANAPREFILRPYQFYQIITQSANFTEPDQSYFELKATRTLRGDEAVSFGMGTNPWPQHGGSQGGGIIYSGKQDFRRDIGQCQRDIYGRTYFWFYYNPGTWNPAWLNSPSAPWTTVSFQVYDVPVLSYPDISAGTVVNMTARFTSQDYRMTDFAASILGSNLLAVDYSQKPQGYVYINQIESSCAQDTVRIFAFSLPLEGLASRFVLFGRLLAAPPPFVPLVISSAAMEIPTFALELMTLVPPPTAEFLLLSWLPSTRRCE